MRSRKMCSTDHKNVKFFSAEANVTCSCWLRVQEPSPWVSMRFHRKARSAGPATHAPPDCCGAGQRKARAACLVGHSQKLEWNKQFSNTAAFQQQLRSSRCLKGHQHLCEASPQAGLPADAGWPRPGGCPAVLGARLVLQVAG